jgi:hypothetical protein
MDKGRRAELVKLKHKKRCKALGIDPKKNYCYKAQAKPCSCYLCTAPRKRPVKPFKLEDDDFD